MAWPDPDVPELARPNPGDRIDWSLESRDRMPLTTPSPFPSVLPPEPESAPDSPAPPTSRLDLREAAAPEPVAPDPLAPPTSRLDTRDAPGLPDRIMPAGLVKTASVEPGPAIQEDRATRAGQLFKPGVMAQLLTRVLGPEEFRSYLAGYRDISERSRALAKGEAQTIEEGQARRGPIEAAARKAIEAYTAASEEPLPAKPGLRAAPKMPDLEPKPWLDPTGRDALQTIAKAFSALAVGIAGIKYKAPLTTLKAYREAIDAWNKEELARGNAKWQEFQAELASVRQDNETALKVYDIADRQYGQHIEAKRLAVLSQLDLLNLEDQRNRAAMLPYEAQRRALDTERETLDHMFNASALYDRVNASYLSTFAKMNKAGASTDAKSYWQAVWQSTDPTLSPEERDRRVRAIQQYQGNAIKQREATAGITMGMRQIGVLDDKLAQVEILESRLRDQMLDYETLYQAGILPDTHAKIDSVIALAKQQFPSRFTPEVAAALRRIRTFTPEITVGLARSIWRDVGVRTREAFGPLQETMIPYPEALGLLQGWAKNIATAKSMYGRQRREMLGYAYPIGAPPSEAPPAEDTEDDGS